MQVSPARFSGESRLPGGFLARSYSKQLFVELKIVLASLMTSGRSNPSLHGRSLGTLLRLPFVGTTHRCRSAIEMMKLSDPSVSSKASTLSKKPTMDVG